MLLTGLVTWQGFHLASIQSGTCFASAELMQHQSQLKTTEEYACCSCVLSVGSYCARQPVQGCRLYMQVACWLRRRS